jgi:hypothetical protein
VRARLGLWSTEALRDSTLDCDSLVVLAFTGFGGVSFELTVYRIECATSEANVVGWLGARWGLFKVRQEQGRRDFGRTGGCVVMTWFHSGLLCMYWIVTKLAFGPAVQHFSTSSYVRLYN